MAKWVYMFTEGNATMRNLLGGKGANLAEMTNLGLPVPQGFTVTTEACTQYYEDGRQINDSMKKLSRLWLVRQVIHAGHGTAIADSFRCFPM